jgi:peptide-methionine (S)-S-oxide reductase
MKILPTLCTIPLFLTAGFTANATELETTVFAGGCFWCVESDFESVKGVTDAVSGYIGGSAGTATYKQIGKGGTGHYEAVKITYDPSVVSYADLVDIFWRSIDATDAGGQFCDRGDSYKSALFALNDEQRRIAENSKEELDASGRLGKSIATKVLNATAFYPAEEYHQDYYKKSDLVLTRYGPKTKKEAYKKYRKACGRDARVRALWGDDAFTNAGS